MDLSLKRDARLINNAIIPGEFSFLRPQSALRKYLYGDLLSKAKVIKNYHNISDDDVLLDLVRVFCLPGEDVSTITLSGDSYFFAYLPTEPELTRTLAYFLDSQQSHGFSGKVARSIIATVRDCISASNQNLPDADAIYENHEKYINFRAYAEHSTTRPIDGNFDRPEPSKARIDVVLTFTEVSHKEPTDHMIIIECKFNADFGPVQLDQYENWLSLMCEHHRKSHSSRRTLKLTRLIITRGRGCVDIVNRTQLKGWQHITWYSLLRTWEKWFPKNTGEGFLYNALQGLRRDLWMEGVLK